MTKAHPKLYEELFRSSKYFIIFFSFLLRIAEHISPDCSISVGVQAVVRQRFEDWDSRAYDNRSEQVERRLVKTTKRIFYLFARASNTFIWNKNLYKAWQSLLSFISNELVNIDFDIFTIRTLHNATDDNLHKLWLHSNSKSPTNNDQRKLVDFYEPPNGSAQVRWAQSINERFVAAIKFDICRAFEIFFLLTC